MNPRERHPATNAPGATRRRMHEAAAWVARSSFRIGRDGGLHLPGLTRTVNRWAPLLRPEHLTPYQRAVLRRALGLTGHAMCRDGRIVHHTLISPPRLAVDGHAYRNRTRRRTRSRR